MKTILGIDYGTKHLGLAIATTPLAEPLTTLQCRDTSAALAQLLAAIARYQPGAVVFGLAESQSADRTRAFANILADHFPGRIFFQDETLTSRESRALMAQEKIPISRRSASEHRLSAALILQRFLDDHPELC